MAVMLSVPLQPALPLISERASSLTFPSPATDEKAHAGAPTYNAATFPAEKRHKTMSRATRLGPHDRLVYNILLFGAKR